MLEAQKHIMLHWHRSRLSVDHGLRGTATEKQLKRIENVCFNSWGLKEKAKPLFVRATTK